MRKGTKKGLKIVAIVATVIVILFITTILLLNTSAVQTWLVDKVIVQLSEQLNTKIEVGRIKYKFPNHLTTDYLYIEDQNNDTLASISHVNANVKLLPIFEKKVVIDGIRVDDPVFKLRTQQDSTLNLQFLIDFFKSDKPRQSNFQFQIQDVEVNNATFSYRDERDTTTHTQFSPKDIRIEMLNTKFSINALQQDYYDIILKELSCREQSGLEINNLSVAIVANNQSCSIPAFELLLPHSDLKLNDITIQYDSLKNLKAQLHNLQIAGEIRANQFYLYDLGALVPKFNNMRKKITLHVDYKGTIDDLTIDTLSAQYGEYLSLQGRLNAKEATNIDSLYVNGNLNALRFNLAAIQDLISSLQQKPFTIKPDKLHNLGNCSYVGQFDGRIDNINLLGAFTTGIGNISTDINLKVKQHFSDIAVVGALKTKRLDLGKILTNELGSTSFDIDLALHTGKDIPLEAEVNTNIYHLAFKGYNYRDIKVDGTYTNKIFDGAINLDDPNGNVDFVGKIDFNRKNLKCDFNSTIENFAPHKMNLVKNERYENLAISLNLEANLQGNKIEQLDGDVFIDDIIIQNNGVFAMDSLYIHSRNTNEGNNLTIESDILNGMIYGKYTIASLTDHIMTMVNDYMPLINYKSKEKNIQSNNDIRFYLLLNSTEEFCDVIGIPWHTTGETTASGFYSDETHMINAEIDVENLTNGSRHITDANIHAYNNEDALIVELNTDFTIPNDTMDVKGTIAMTNDTIKANLLWHNLINDSVTAGEFVARAHISRQNDQLFVDGKILPTQLFILNKPFEIGEAGILYSKDRIVINKFEIASNDQHIIIDGVASKSIDDVLTINLNNISLDYISSLLNAPGVELGGDVSGEAKMQSILADKPLIDAHIQSPNLKAYGSEYGHVSIGTEVDTENKRINFNGLVFGKQIGTDTLANVHGFYSITNDSLDIVGKANKLDISFINHFTGSFMTIKKGLAIGNVHIYRPNKQGIIITAKAFVDSAAVCVDYLNTTYYFNDTLELTKNSIILDNIAIADKDGNHGTLNGRITHDSHFKDLKYNINVAANKMMVFDLKRTPDAIFYGKGFATGNAKIQGNTNQCNIMVDVTTEPNTKVSIPIDGASVAADNSFITFIDFNQPIDRSEIEETAKRQKSNKKNILTLNILANITPDVELELILNQQTGDIIRAHGEGAVRLELDAANNFKMFGNCNILDGTYNFTLQNAITKVFNVNSGGNILWTGDAASPNINISAYYQTNASLTDVLPSDVLENVGRKTVPVQCLLNISGSLNQPDLAFDIKLPNSDEELNSALKSAIHTDEDMRRQIIYLLLVGRFQPASENTGTNPVFGQNELLSVVSSTLSSQLNNWASQMFDKWDIGVNMRSSGEGQDRSMEYELQLNYAPNERITINSNVGYRDDNLNANASNFIGDFDVEYKILRSGKLSAKAYTHTNDYREFKESMTTQGIGIVYRESFNSSKGLKEEWRKTIQENKAERRLQRDKRRAHREAVKNKIKNKKTKKKRADTQNEDL